MITLYCEWCGEPFQRRVAEVRRQKQQFCSRECHRRFIGSQQEFNLNQVWLYRVLTNPAHARVSLTPKRNGRPAVKDEHNDNAVLPMLTESDIRDIRARVGNGDTVLSIGQHYDIPPRIVTRIAEGKLYAWVAEEDDQ